MRLLQVSFEWFWQYITSLNPYSTGNEVVARWETSKSKQAICLNPYSTGNEVVAGLKHCAKPSNLFGLNPYSTGNEVVAGMISAHVVIRPPKGLNPYSTGNEVVA